MARFRARPQAWPWYARVSTHSNVADAPSRLDFTGMTRMGARAEPLPDHIWDL